MADCTVTLNMGSGADVPTVRGRVDIHRLTMGDNGEMVISTNPTPALLTYPFATIDLDQDTDYAFVRVSPAGPTDYKHIPAEATKDYSDLEDVIPVFPSAGILGDPLVSGLVEDLDSDTRAALVAMFSDPDGVNDEFIAGKVDDDASATAVALDGKYGPEAWAAHQHKYESTFNILDYGAKVDGRELTDVSMTSGSAVLDSAGYTFTAGDIGKKVGVAGAGTVSTDFNTNANDGVLIATISSVSGGNATLSVAAVNTVSGAVAVFGTPDDTAIAAAQTAAVANGGGVVFFPPGRTIVTLALYCQNYVSWAGVHRDVSWVDVIFDAGTETATNKLSWLHCSGRTSANPLTGASLHDFGVNARFQIRSGGYVPGIKALNIFHVNRCAITNMNVWNTGGTAIPFDHQYESVLIGWNIIKNPGRLYPIYDTSAVKYGRGGGSGIGIGTINDGTVEPGLIIGNTILGVGSSAAALPKGNNGIFLEAQGISTDPALPAVGFRIADNYVSGMWAGIRDAGALGTIVANNTVVKCVKGIALDFTAVRGSYPGQDALVIGNVVSDCYADTDNLREGCAVSITGDKDHGSSVRARIVENVFLRSGGRAVYVEVGYNPIERLVIARNKIRGAVRSGIYFALSTVTASYLNRPSIIDNDIAEHGSGGVSNDTHGINIYVEAKHLTMKNNRVVGANGFRLGATGNLSEAGEVSGNDFPDVAVGSGTISQTVRIFGNLGWLTQDIASVILIQPAELFIVNGTPVLAHTNRHPRWAFPDAATSIIGANVVLPSDWNTATVSILYAAQTLTGVATMRADLEVWDTGDTILAASPTAGTAVNATVDTTVRSVDLGTITPAGKRNATINIARTGSVAADTLAADALVLGVKLVRAS